MESVAEGIDRIAQRRLVEHHMSDRSVHLCSGADMGLEIVVDGQVYQDLAEVEDLAIRDLIQASVDEWQALHVKGGAQDALSVRQPDESPAIQADLPESERRSRSREARWALVLAGFPLALALVLAALNPEYMSRMVTTTCGWMMTGASLALMAIGYVLLRVILSVSVDWDPPRWLAHRSTMRVLLVLCVLVSFVGPALLVVLLGPAILLLMESGVLGSVQ